MCVCVLYKGACIHHKKLIVFSLTSVKLILPQEVRGCSISVMLPQLDRVFSRNPISVIPQTALRQSGAAIGIHP